MTGGEEEELEKAREQLYKEIGYVESEEHKYPLDVRRGEGGVEVWRRVMWRVRSTGTPWMRGGREGGVEVWGGGWGYVEGKKYRYPLDVRRGREGGGGVMQRVKEHRYPLNMRRGREGGGEVTCPDNLSFCALFCTCS